MHTRRCFCTLLLLGSSLWLAYADKWDGTTDNTLDLTTSTIAINTSAQLARVAQAAQTDDFTGKTLRLTADLDLDNRAWTPIGSQAKPFAGTFEGNGHQIANVKVSGSDCVGLFGAVGATGAVQNVAITSGTFEGDSQIGSLTGYNAGTISNCFAMAVVEYKNGTAGGLVGYNAGTISYVYTTGRLYKRQSAAGFAGGLVGENSGTVTDGYSVALVDGENAGGLIGNNSGTLERLYWDKQMSNPNQTSVKNGTTTGATTKDQTTEMYAIFSSDAKWKIATKYYPELAVFAGTEFSLVSVCPVVFHKNACAGAVKKFEDQTYFTGANSDKNGNIVTWTSAPAPDQIKGPISYILGGGIYFLQRCGQQEATLTATLGTSHKDVYVVVAGYDNFTPGAIKTNGTFDLHEAYCFGNDATMKVESDKPALGGNEEYRYLFREYKLEKGDDGKIDTLSSRIVADDKSATLSGYKPQDYGTYMVVRYARDGLCQLEPLRSDGAFFVTVLPPPDAGAIDSTMSGLMHSGEDSLVIGSLRDASLDTAAYNAHNKKYNQLTYAWDVFYSQYDWVTGDSLQKTIRIASRDTLTTDSSTLVFDVSRVGEYFIYRYVRSDCSKTSIYLSEGVVHLTVFDPFEAGCIDGDSLSGRRVICQTDLTQPDSIAQAAAPSGGSGVYQYRWTVGGVPIANADSAFCLMDLSQLQPGKPLVVHREVRDTIAQVGWQPSADSVTYILYAPFDVGAVAAADSTLCLTTEQQIDLRLGSAAAASGGDEAHIAYRWTLLLEQDGQQMRDTLHATAADALYRIDLSNAKLPLTIIAVRQVTDGACQADWIASRDTVRYYISRESEQENPLWICEEQLPYDYTYTLADGSAKVLHFATEKDTVAVDDVNALGCALRLKFYILLRGKASIDVTRELYACQTTDSVTIGINSPVGSLRQYTLRYDEAATKAGFESQNKASLPDNLAIPIAIPQNTPPGIYHAYLQFSDGADEGVCASAEYDITISIGADGYLHTKWSDVIFVDNNDKNGRPDAESDLSFTAFQWYKDGELLSGATESFYYEQGGLNGIYYAVVTTADGTTMRLCDIEVRPSTALAAVAVTDFSVFPVPATAGAQLTLVLPENAHTLDIYNAFGTLVDTVAIGNRRVVEIHAPAAAGVYLLRAKLPSGAVKTIKLIVR